jgi:hypothetical protein
MKPTILKAWPEMEEYAPLLTSPSEASKITPLFNIDFSECYIIDSCGLAAFLLKIMQYAKIFKEGNMSWISTGFDNNMELKENIVKLRFFNPLKSSCYDELLFASEYFSSNDVPVESEIFGAYKLSFPLVYIDFVSSNDRRNTGITLLKQILFERIINYSNIYNLNIMQFISILIELVKNTADHTNANAIFGMDLLEANNSMKINFFYGDLGIGITRHVKRYLKKINDPRWEYLSLSEAYYIACKKGFTSKPNNGINLGLGMSTVIEFAKTMNMRISVFDASSRGLLSEIDQSESYSHSKMRRKFFIYSRKNPFCYFGTLEVGRK